MTTPPARRGTHPAPGPGLSLLLCGLCLLCWTGTAAAAERYALIVSGAAGGPEYARQYAAWTRTMIETLGETMKIGAGQVIALGNAGDPRGEATAANVRRGIAELRGRMAPGDLLFVLLIGHGTFDGVDAKFNLVGPDLSASDWAGLLSGLPGTVVLVNSAPASFQFLERLAGPRRIVIAATDSPAQRFDTVFPQYFVAAFGDEAADIDKNGRVSIWEAFAAASAGVRRHYQQQGQLATERALLDDNGDGTGREAASQGPDGALASRTYLDVTPPGAAPTDEVLVDLLQRQASLKAEAEELQVKKAFMAADEYAREFERLMIALARVARDIRTRSGS
jgi:hypothetical protein